MRGEFGFPRSDGYDLWENIKKLDSLKILYPPPSTEGAKGYGKG